MIPNLLRHWELATAFHLRYLPHMGVAELMNEIRKLPDGELLALAAQVDVEAARAVDEKFSAKVREGVFDDLAAEALKELNEGKTIPLHEVLDERRVP